MIFILLLSVTARIGYEKLRYSVLFDESFPLLAGCRGGGNSIHTPTLREVFFTLRTKNSLIL